MISNLNDLIKEYLNREDWRVNENSNMGYSLQGLNYYLYSSLIARYWLEEIYPPEIARAHQNGDFHIHDLGSLSVYCVGWDLEDLLLKGFGGVEGKVAR
jgi:anaerobic ribonucleoside-triphosphate reductase